MTAKNSLLILCLIIIMALLSGTVFAVLSRFNSVLVRQIEVLCAEYAVRDHEKEFVPERWELIKDIYSSQDWYKSCINHSSRL